ncbi:MAG: hypothetical protein P8181_06430 [bacterium]
MILWNAGCDVVDVSEERRVQSGETTAHSWILTSKKGRRYELQLAVPAGDRCAAWVDVVSGRQTPMLGWYSPGYRRMVPVTVFQAMVGAPGSVVIRTRIRRL